MATKKSSAKKTEPTDAPVEAAPSETVFVTYTGKGGGASHGGVPGVFFGRGKVVEVTAEQWAVLEGAGMDLVLCDEDGTAAPKE